MKKTEHQVLVTGWKVLRARRQYETPQDRQPAETENDRDASADPLVDLAHKERHPLGEGPGLVSPYGPDPGGIEEFRGQQGNE